MIRRLAGAIVVVSCGLLLVTGNTVAMAAPIGGDAPRSAESGPDTDVEAPGFARERGISLDEARQRLGWQRVAPDLGQQLDEELGDRFGGIWVDVHDGDRIKIGIVDGPDPDTSAMVQQAAEALGLTEGYDLVSTRHPMAALEEDNDWLGTEIARVNRDATATLAAGLRPDLNAVELQAPVEGDLTEDQQGLIDEATDRLGDRLVVGSYEGRPEARACVYPYCDPPLRGGIRIANGAGCTGAFIAKSKVDDKLYQLTAGHCAYQHYSDWSTKFTDGSTHVIGPVWTWWWWGGGDMSILRINNVPGWNPKAWVYVTSGPDTTADSTYHISSDNLSVLGMRICTTGAFYGHSDCGYVTQLGLTMTYSNVTVHHLGRASFCGTQGDSGSPMYALHVAYGLQVSGFSECDSVYQGIRAAENVLNVNVLHSNS
jgi:hypothetical protein